MELNLIRLRTVLDDRESEIVKANDQFIDTINDELMDDDLLLVEDSLNAAFDVFFIETGGSETKFLSRFENVKPPVILLSNGKNNSLPASLEIKSYCSLHDIPAVILTGDEHRIASILKPFARAVLAKKQMENNNLGLVGEPSDWLIASQISDDDAKKIFNINLIHISMEEFKAEIEKHELMRIPHINDFKKINDTYGHSEGDCALVILSGAITSVIRNHHMPIFLARYGGDEFILIVRPLEESEMDALIADLRESIIKKCEAENKPYRISIGIGIDKLQKSEDDAFAKSLKRADDKMYDNKQSMKQAAN